MIWKQEGSCEQPTMFHTADSPQKFLGHGKAVELVCFLGGGFLFFFVCFSLGGGAGSVAHCIDLQQWCLTVVKEQRKNTFVRTQKKIEH